MEGLIYWAGSYIENGWTNLSQNESNKVITNGAVDSGEFSNPSYKQNTIWNSQPTLFYTTEHISTGTTASITVPNNDHIQVDDTRQQTAADTIREFYNNILDRAPDQAGFDGWVAALESGQMTERQVFDSFISSTEYQSNPNLWN